MTASGEADIPTEFWVGVEQFNQGEFYACHDTLEAIWMEAIEPDRTFYQGILQIAVGLYHLSNHNWRGCVILMGEGIRRLQRYQPDYSAIAVSPFVQDAQALLHHLQQSGPEAVEAIAHQVHDRYPVTTSSNPDNRRAEEPVAEVPQIELRSPTITRII